MQSCLPIPGVSNFRISLPFDHLNSRITSDDFWPVFDLSGRFFTNSYESLLIGEYWFQKDHLQNILIRTFCSFSIRAMPPLWSKSSSILMNYSKRKIVHFFFVEQTNSLAINSAVFNYIPWLFLYRRNKRQLQLNFFNWWPRTSLFIKSDWKHFIYAITNIL